MATLRERMRARREAERRGLRSFTIGVSEDDLRVIAKHGYEGAASADQDERAQAVSLFITDVLASIGRGNGVTTVATPFQERCHHRCNAVSVVSKIASEQFGRRSRARGQVRDHPAPVLDRDLEIVALKEPRFSPQLIDLAVKLSPAS